MTSVAGRDDSTAILPLRIRIGCAGWNVPRESAASFPAGGSHLERYAQVMNCVEINSSFYRAHKKQTWERWAAAVPADFRFSVKASRTITHDAELDCERGLLCEFLEQVRVLGDKLGPVLFQLPPHLVFDRTRVAKFLTLLRQNYAGDAVWEPRHASWFDGRADDLLKEFRVARVAADPGCVTAAFTAGGFEGLVYFRLHGSPRRYYSSYSANFLSQLLEQWERLSPQTVAWCVFDNTASGSAVQNALELMRMTSSTSELER